LDYLLPDTRFHRLFGIAAGIGLALSLAVHLASLAGVDVAARIPAVWALHLGVFAVFVPFLLSSRKSLGNRPTRATLRAIMPGWAYVLYVAVLSYALANFFLVFSSQQGTATAEGGRYILQNHGRLIRDLTPAEYTAARAAELRGFSGHWLLFYFVPFGYFMFAKAPQRESPRNAEPPPIPGAA